MTAFQQFISPAFHQFIRFTPATHQLINSSREPPKLRLSRAKGSPQQNQPKGRGLRFPLRPHESEETRAIHLARLLGARKYLGGLGDTPPARVSKPPKDRKENNE
jgi:hypothetical protein